MIWAELNLELSGMPLLDRLKTSISPPSGLSLPEKWISLSMAIGMDMELQPLPDSLSPERAPMRGSEDGLRVEDETLWPRLLSICPQDMVDGSVCGGILQIYGHSVSADRSDRQISTGIFYHQPSSSVSRFLDQNGILLTPLQSGPSCTLRLLSNVTTLLVIARIHHLWHSCSPSAVYHRDTLRNHGLEKQTRLPAC